MKLFVPLQITRMRNIHYLFSNFYTNLKEKVLENDFSSNKTLHKPHVQLHAGNITGWGHCTVIGSILGSVHKYFGGGGWAKWRGAKKVLSYQKGGGAKKFSLVKGGVKKVWSNWKYNENQNAQFAAKINRT